jgi:hypothetical protein
VSFFYVHTSISMQIAIYCWYAFSLHF